MFGQLSKKDILSVQVWGLYTVRDWCTSSSGKWHDNSQNPCSHLDASQDAGSASHVGTQKHLSMYRNDLVARLVRDALLAMQASCLCQHS